MKLALAFAVTVQVSFCQRALSQTPGDFQGTWKVSRMVGAADIHSGSDNYETPLGTSVVWTKTAVTDIDGTCRIAHATVAPVSTETLQHDIWGGQTIGGLSLPKTLIAKAFGKDATPVFDDGDKQCSQAIMLNHNQILLMFWNGYIYLLDRSTASQRTSPKLR